MQSQILRIPTGYVNQMNNPVIGEPSIPGGTGLSKFSGQLGKRVNLVGDMLKYNSTVGTVYDGWFQSVILDPDLADEDLPAIGQPMFWLTPGSADWKVTTDPTPTLTYGGTAFAGICLSDPWTQGYESLIQNDGLVLGLFGTVSGTKATGRPVVIDPATGLLDVDDTPAPEYLVGWARGLPADDSLVLIQLRPSAAFA